MNSQGGHTVAFEIEAYPYFTIYRTVLRTKRTAQPRGGLPAFFSRCQFLMIYGEALIQLGIYGDDHGNLVCESDEHFDFLVKLATHYTQTVVDRGKA